MLCLECTKLRAWPTGIPEMSGLRYLYLYCTRMQDQNLAALQHIPHVSPVFDKFSTFVLTSGSWRSLEIWEEAGFHIRFFNVDAFVRGTERFLVECPSQEAEGMYRMLRAACMRQGVACHGCEHLEGYPERTRVARLSNVELCRAPADEDVTEAEEFLSWTDHDPLIRSNNFWPERAAFPEVCR